MAENGLITIASNFPVGETLDRLADLATAKGLSIFARVDHAAGAAKVGMALRPTQLLIFGNPNGGTPLMQDRQSAGIDLPLKALTFEDESGRVWLTYDDPAWISVRHGLGEASRKAVDAIAAGMAGLTKAATSR